MRLVGVGVGPGDPEMMTLAALREIQQADTVFVPVLSSDDEGRAEAVVRAHLGADERVERLVFALADPVGGPQEHRRKRWGDAAQVVVERLRGRGGTVAFATLGDPTVYSTFTYLSSAVSELLPEVATVMVPGITAMQAAASQAGVSLVEGTEPLTVIPLAREVNTVREALDSGGTVVAYKGGRRLGELRTAIAESGALERSVYAEHLGTHDARVLPLSEVVISEVDGSEVAATGSRERDEPAPYLSTVVVLPPRGARGEQL